MKKVSSCILALMLALGSSIVVAAPGHGDRDHKGAKHHRGHKDYKVGRHHNMPRIEHSARHKNKHHRKHARHYRKHEIAKAHRQHHRKHRQWRHQRWDRHLGYRNGWRYNHWDHRGKHHRNWHHSRRHYRGGHYSDYLGAALVGSALTYSLYHLHDGAVCYDSHPEPRDRHYRSSEVVGCHRIERHADGSQVRVDVPMAECR